MITADQARARVVNALAYLDSLGSPDAIANDLERLGIKGNPSDSCSCPIGVYLNRHTEQWLAYVGPTCVLFGWNGPRSVVVPPNVTRFVVEFDQRRYPQLLNEFPSI